MHLDPSAVSILRAVFGMGLLTFAMAGWMGLTRLPAMRRAGLKLQDAAHTADLKDRLPSSARRISDNYNNLFEAPTVFYAVALGILAAGLADPIHAACAWTFLAARLAHSLVQATVNLVPIRLVFFVISWTAVGVMVVRALMAL